MRKSYVSDLLAAIDVDTQENTVKTLINKATKVFTGELIECLDTIRRDKEQTIDHDNLDSVQFTGWDKNANDNAKILIDEFKDYLEANKDEIDALSIFYSTPHSRREITFDMIQELFDKLKSDKPTLAPLNVWQAYEKLENYQGKQPISEITALVSLIRHSCGLDKKLTAYDDTVRKNFQNWILKYHSGSGEKFNSEQMEWLRMIRDHLISSFHFERDDLEISPFDAQGGLGKMYQLFGDNMDNLIDELNEELAA